MKYYIAIVLLIVYVIISFWIFNHVNPWVSIILDLITLGLIINYIKNKIKTNN